MNDSETRKPGKAMVAKNLLMGGALVLAALAAYWNSFSVPFIFDDLSAITENPSLRRLWPAWDVLSPPHGMTVSGRPVLNLSLAVNHALGGTAVRGYHALNLAIHILAGLTLLGLVRRTLLQPVLRARFAAAALPLALAVAVLWTLHPLQTESVTYVIQRAESLMGLFYLLTLYCFVRGTESPAPGRWQVLAVGACLLGMATKEVMVSAPLMVLLYDRTFVAGTFREAWRKRRRLYAGLAGTWLLLGCLVAGTGGTRDGTTGFGPGGVSWWACTLTQCQAVVHYLWLSVWAHPLILDYGAVWVKQVSDGAPQALIVILLMAGAVAGLCRGTPTGFAGGWFFAILAPTSVLSGAKQTMAEHRMYLSLAAVVALEVLVVYALIGRRSLVVFLVLAAGLGALASQRNGDYRSALAIWSDTAAKRPGNALAQNNLGNALQELGRKPEAERCYEEAMRLDPDYFEAPYNLGRVLAQMDRLPEAIGHYKEALRLKPDYVPARFNLANALHRTGWAAEAIGEYQATLRLKPDHVLAHINLGNTLAQLGRLSEAIGHYKEALRLKPDSVMAHDNLGNALLLLGRITEAVDEYQEALRINPDYEPARTTLDRVQALRKTTRVSP